MQNLLALLLLVAPPGRPEIPTANTIKVPLDYSKPSAGSGHIYFELAEKIDRKKPFLFVIADGQQFYVRKGRLRIVAKEFGPAFNVVGIVGRAEAPDIAAACSAKGNVDWAKAWRYYRSYQWIEDIEKVRRKLVGSKGKILLYGASGGAMLAHEYMNRYGRFVSRCFTSAAVMPFIEAELNLSPPTLWSQLNTEQREEMGKVLDMHREDRQIIAITFQRQHFFFSADKLAQARTDLIHSLASGDAEAFKKARTDYQVDALLGFMATGTAIPIRIREYEFLAAAHRLVKPPLKEFDPDMEAEYDYALPLIQLRTQGKIGEPTMDFAALHRLTSEVLIVAGVHDEAVDYRSSISLAARYPSGHIVIFNDNHVFSKLRESGSRDAITRAFLQFGYNSRQCQSALHQARSMLWDENSAR